MAESVTFLAPTDLVSVEITALHKQVNPLIEQSEGDFLIDLARVSMIDSKGIGLLVLLIKQLETQGRKLGLINTSPEIAELLKVMRLGHRMSIS